MAKLVATKQGWCVVGFGPRHHEAHRLNQAAVDLLYAHGIRYHGDWIVDHIAEKVFSMIGLRLNAKQPRQMIHTFVPTHRSVHKAPTRPVRSASDRKTIRPSIRHDPPVNLSYKRRDPRPSLRVEYLLVRENGRWFLEQCTGENRNESPNRHVYAIRLPHSIHTRFRSKLSIPIGRSESLRPDGCLFDKHERWGQRIPDGATISRGHTYYALCPGHVDTDSDSISIGHRSIVIPKQVSRRWLGECGSWSLYEIQIPVVPHADVACWIRHCGYKLS